MKTHCGSNIRLTACLSQGGRRYMEDAIRIECKRSESGAVDYVFIGVFDGHGGLDASKFAKERLLENIVVQPQFHSGNDTEVLDAIRLGFNETHQQMWKEVDKWPKTASGYTSTSGTTASIAFIKNGKVYTGHVGDSAIVLGEWEKRSSGKIITSKRLTVDHKPDSPEEWRRIESAGGEVQVKAGVYRVVWMRPRRGHQGAVRRSTLLDKIPFLAVARSLGDLWSYNCELDTFVVSPEPDVDVFELQPSHCCLVFGSDGLWNVLRPQNAVEILNSHEWRYSPDNQSPITCQSNHARLLVRHALLRWGGLRADNITAIAVIFDPPGCQYAPVHPGTPRLLKPSESLTTRLDTTAVNCLLRIGSTETHLIETSPVELVYYGQVDPKLPEVEDSSIRLVESMPADTNDVAPDSPNVVITTEFIQATSAVSVHMRDESGSDSPVLANDNSDQVVPPGPHPCTVVQQSIFHLVSQSTAVEGNNTHLERQELTTTTVTTSNVEGNPLKKRKYYCKKHGHNCIKAKQMNSDWLAQCSKTSNHLNSAADQSQDNSEEEVSHSEETVEKSPKEAEIPTSMISAVEPELSPNGIIESSPSVGSKRESPANERQQRRSILKGISVMGTRLGRTRSTGPNVTRSGKVYHKSIPNFTSSLTSERRSLRNRSLSPKISDQIQRPRSAQGGFDPLFDFSFQPRVTLTRLPISSNSSQLLSPSPSSQESKRTGRRVAKAATIKSGAKQSASSKVAAGLKTRLNKFRAEVAKSAHKFRLEKLKRCVKEHLNKTKMEKDLKGHADVDGRIRRSRPFSSLRITGAIRNPSKTSLQRSLSLPKNGGHLTEVIRSKSPASNSCSKGTSMLASLNLEDSASVSSTAFLHSACLHRQSTLDSDWCHCQHGVQSGNSCSVLRCAQSPQKSLMKEIRSPHAKDYTSERKLNGFESTDIVSSLRSYIDDVCVSSASGTKRKIPSFDDDFLLVSGGPTSKLPRYRSFLESRLSMTVETPRLDWH